MTGLCSPDRDQACRQTAPIDYEPFCAAHITQVHDLLWRTFWPGDDPYWEAVNLHYWETNNLEWYHPSAITTANGSLVITLEQKEINNLNYQGGMMSTWNKFCYTGGMVEASVVLPGANNVVGMWPAIWQMGNLGRAGYGASLEGTVGSLHMTITRFI